MEPTASNRFEVRISRWQAALATILFATFAAIVLWLEIFGEIKSGGCFLLVVVIILTFASTAFASLWLRHRPLYAIDDQGITDYGYFSQGFGLIKWQNIESITSHWLSKSGLYCFVRVNNYDELVSRRNLLMWPPFFLCGILNGFFGGQISLPVGVSDTDIETLRQRISTYSRTKIQLPTPLKPYQEILPSLAASVVILGLTGAILILAWAVYSLYWLWHLKQ